MAHVGTRSKCELLKIPCPKTPTPLYVVDPSIFHSYTIMLLCTFNGSTCKQITFSAAQSKSNHCTNPGLTQTKFLDLQQCWTCIYLNQIIKHHTKLTTPSQKSPVRISWSKPCWSWGRDHWQDQPEDSRGTATAVGCGWTWTKKSRSTTAVFRARAHP